MSYPILEGLSLFIYVDSRHWSLGVLDLQYSRVTEYECTIFHNFKPVLWPLTERLERKKSKVRDKQTT